MRGGCCGGCSGGIDAGCGGGIDRWGHRSASAGDVVGAGRHRWGLGAAVRASVAGGGCGGCGGSCGGGIRGQRGLGAAVGASAVSGALVGGQWGTWWGPRHWRGWLRPPSPAAVRSAGAGASVGGSIELLAHMHTPIWQQQARIARAPPIHASFIACPCVRCTPPRTSDLRSRISDDLGRVASRQPPDAGSRSRQLPARARAGA
jgi:hypothetical protein